MSLGHRLVGLLDLLRSRAGAAGGVGRCGVVAGVGGRRAPSAKRCDDDEQRENRGPGDGPPPHVPRLARLGRLARGEGWHGGGSAVALGRLQEQSREVQAGGADECCLPDPEVMTKVIDKARGTGTFGTCKSLDQNY